MKCLVVIAGVAGAILGGTGAQALTTTTAMEYSYARPLGIMLNDLTFCRIDLSHNPDAAAFFAWAKTHIGTRGTSYLNQWQLDEHDEVVKLQNLAPNIRSQVCGQYKNDSVKVNGKLAELRSGLDHYHVMAHH